MLTLETIYCETCIRCFRVTLRDRQGRVLTASGAWLYSMDACAEFARRNPHWQSPLEDLLGRPIDMSRGK